MRKLFLALILILMAAPAHAVDMEDVDFGGFVRLRGYSMENMWDFNDDTDGDEWSVFRLMTSLHAGMALSDDVGVFVQLANQNYSEGVTYAPGLAPERRWEADNTSNKVFVDNAYIDIFGFFGLPVDLRLGRQNLMYGTGFVLFDGQSQFASTSVYFDGAKLTWDITEKAKLDLLYVKDQEFDRADGADDDITLAGGYLTAQCPVIGGQQEVYVLNRKDEGFGKDIWMYGLRLSDKFAIGLDYSAEIAYQGGDFDEDAGIDQDALGYKLEAGWTFDLGIKPRVFAAYAYLSGDDDLADDKNESWDVYYGGWPQFGDLLAWVFVNGPAAAANTVTGFSSGASVGGEAAYSNLILPEIGVSFFVGPLFTELSYTMLTIDEPVIAGGDDDFGDYYQLKAKYDYNKHLSFAAYAAMIEPGDAFSELTGPVSDDTVYETFWEARVNF